jgi:hypothetical protein
MSARQPRRGKCEAGALRQPKVFEFGELGIGRADGNGLLARQITRAAE